MRQQTGAAGPGAPRLQTSASYQSDLHTGSVTQVTYRRERTSVRVPRMAGNALPWLLKALAGCDSSVLQLVVTIVTVRSLRELVWILTSADYVGRIASRLAAINVVPRSVQRVSLRWGP